MTSPEKTTHLGRNEVIIVSAILACAVISWIGVLQRPGMLFYFCAIVFSSVGITNGFRLLKTHYQSRRNER